MKKLLRYIKQTLGAKQKPHVIQSRDGACIWLLPNLLHHATLRTEGKVTADFQTWAKKTYGDVKFI